MCPMPALLVSFLLWLMRTTREEWRAKHAAKQAALTEAGERSPA